jgi:fructosamine-3-kinase
LREAAAMKLVAEHTTIPIPKIICAFERKGSTYTVMEVI